MSENIAHEVHPAPLPCGAQHLTDGRLDPFVRIGDHELDPTQPPSGPDRFRFRDFDLHAQNFTPAITVDADGNDGGHRDDTPTAAHLEAGGIDA